VAKKNEEAVFVQTTDAAVGKAAGLTAPGIAVVTNHEGALRAAAAAGWRLAAGGCWLAAVLARRALGVWRVACACCDRHRQPLPVRCST
jgi:hypothetical protein